MSFKGFGSDNHAGVHPQVLAAIEAANEGHAHAYGDDPWTRRAVELILDKLGPDADVALVFNGTGANVVCLASACRPWQSVICARTAHINCDECAAPEHIAGVKLVPVDTPDGKLTPDLIAPELKDFGFEHAAQPRVISISQVTEYGTVYTAEEIRALADIAHAHEMLLHMDGARIANAAVALGIPLRALTADAGVDLLSFGGTKNGMLAGEAVVLFGAARGDHLPYVRKQSAQLSSKMRFVAAQFIAMYDGDLWHRCAAHANEMAARLSAGAAAAGITVTQPAQANEVFALLPREQAARLIERFHFYVWDERPGATDVEVRWVTSWDTSTAEVDALLQALLRAHPQDRAGIIDEEDLSGVAGTE